MNKTFSLEKNYIRVLSKLFSGTEASLLQKVLEKSITTHVKTGDLLFKQGDTQKTLFIVLSGRFRVVAEIDDKIHILGDVAEGEPIGEFALFTNEPRSASVYAMRPSVVLEMNESTYAQIVSLQPEFATKLTSILLKRIKRNNLKKHLEAAPKNIAIINLQSEIDISPWTDPIQKHFEQTGVEFCVYDHDSFDEGNQNEFYEGLEQNDAVKFFICSEAHPEWTKQCLVYADQIIVATDFYESSEVSSIEEKLALYQQNILTKKTYLLLLHPENGVQPANTKRWLENRLINLHIHYRKNHAGDTARFCRIITNKAVGLVLGGGGAKGFAHLGALKALLNEGIQIDFLGGTSAGALYGFVMVFCDFDVAKIEHYAEISVKSKLTSNDVTIPLISMMTGKKIKKFISFLFGTTCIEDFWISAYCISANYSTASIKIHESGLAWKQVQASIAIPGVFPPVVIDKQLYVDGGVMDNLPIQPMFKYPVGHIIAIALSSSEQRDIELTDTPSSWTLLWDKILGRKKFRLPGLSSIIINSLILNSTQRQEQYKGDVSLYIELKLKGIGILDDTKWKLIVQKGHDQMSQFLKDVKATERFW